MTAQEIRQAFLDFFASKGHQIVPSAPIVVKNDPALMFTNAGMNQFKGVFLGEEPIKFPRVVDTQRCLRVSGKHDDLEEVGIDTYHHTMFEMLGNWSFGDYFKKEAIAWSWELLTEIYKIEKDRLYVTVFEGDEKEGLPKDQEAIDLWLQYVNEDHIVLGNKKDNFWEMGETGPCGPCSEIHYDGRSLQQRLELPGRDLVNQDNPDVIEIWNNVFMQFNRVFGGEKGGLSEYIAVIEENKNNLGLNFDIKKWKSDNLFLYSKLIDLPAKHIDTGMGFERLVRVMQGKASNYDTDIFQPLIQFISEKSGIKYEKVSDNSGADKMEAISMRVMADHIRAISFAIIDGQLPSNNKAGYVIRRILRRAVRYSYQFLGIKEPFLNKLVLILAEQFKGVFNELWEQREFVKKVVLEEELAFLRTLEKGILRFDIIMTRGAVIPSNAELTKEINAYRDRKILHGFVAFELFDTFGFPIDLTELMAKDFDFTVDIAGYEAALQQQKNRSRAATAIDTGDWIVLKDDETVEFVGYNETETIAHVVKYRKVKAKGVEQYQLVLDKTPFYAESGGQVGDTGELVFPDGEIVAVTDTKKENGLIVHFVDKLPQDIDDALTAIVDLAKRKATNNNHSATHLLHAALKQVLGTHVNQKGSLVNGEYLRFDFSHFSKVTDNEIAQIEAIVNEKIRENINVDIKELPKEEAIALGANALFGEKYGDTVRVVTIDAKFSIELCGGTHVQSTGQIGYFKIITESAVAAGVRRIEAITGLAAEKYIGNQNKLIQDIKELLKNPKDIAKSIKDLMDENSKLKKELEKSILEKASGLKQGLAAQVQNINGVNFIAQKVDLPNADAIKNLAYSLKDIVPNLYLVLVAEIDGKPNITVMIEESLVKEKGLNAGSIIRELAKEIQGGGGGQPFYATAGGKDVSGLPKVLEKAKAFIPAG
ncbi:alanyl-tRNA synthetase [Mucilaginibacter gracilis]|uniref:Alanine--tRNA ligase n=1 Tax=Mucilaginibacter gracilis TaxID=423350 RepID=A0A495J4G1_9SPHI|nr:alanine--tRNA ligase [Mucilaginibacter gracilis]RKR83847.1 alanyl-tRNA synthetase [Mucilaginibacter gracilis]